MSSKADEYQKLAAECLLLAITATDQATKATLLQMARAWLEVAEQHLSSAEEFEVPPKKSTGGI